MEIARIVLGTALRIVYSLRVHAAQAADAYADRDCERLRYRVVAGHAFFSSMCTRRRPVSVATAFAQWWRRP